MPPWVATEFKFGFDKALNNDGTFDYNGDSNPRSITAWDRKERHRPAGAVLDR